MPKRWSDIKKPSQQKDRVRQSEPSVRRAILQEQRHVVLAEPSGKKQVDVSAVSLPSQKRVSEPASSSFEIKPGFFVPRSSAIMRSHSTESQKKEEEAQVAANQHAKKSSSEFFSALGVHNETLQNEKSPVRVILPHESHNEASEAASGGARLDIPMSDMHAPKHRSLLMPVLSFLGVLAILGGALFLLGFFTTAFVSITPRQEAISVSGALSAERGEGELSFETISVQGEESQEVPADLERQVEERASGTIVIYNAYSTAPQRLIKNTRFATIDGKIFRVKDSVVVPGMTTENTKTTPGSVEAIVVADEAGEKYNIGLSDFTIPGFKGDPRYDKFYARSKTEMSGGFSGNKKFPSEQVIAETRETLRARLTEKLSKDIQAQTQILNGFIVYPGATRSVLADDPSISIDGSRATITERGVISGIMFKKDELAQHIAKKSLATFDGGGMDIPDMDTFIFSFDTEPTFEETEISFSLEGTAHIIWRVDSEGLIAAIAGKPRKEFNGILGSFANIRRAEASIRPFFMRSFPKDPARISATIIVE